MCCDPIGADPSDGEEGVCEHCGSTTYGGISDDICAFSPQICKWCDCSPCDDSC